MKFSKEILKERMIKLINEKFDGKLPSANLDELFKGGVTASKKTYLKYFKVKTTKDIFDAIGVEIREETLTNMKKYSNKNTYITKDDAIKLIYAKAEKLNRALMYDDFRNPKYGDIGITTIKRYWGTMNKMKKALNLEIIQEDMTCKHMNYEEIVPMLLEKCREILTYKEVVTTKDINKVFPIKAGAIDKELKSNETSIRELLQINNIPYQEPGNGNVHYYDDGEISKSTYEYDFTNKLREFGLIYDVDYFRDVKYKTFIDGYDGLLDCDYKINIGGEWLYVEIAGMLRDHKKNYINGQFEVKSKSKTNYMQKLKNKEEMLKDNNLDHMIIFPSDMNTEDKLDLIFETIKSKINKLKEKI